MPKIPKFNELTDFQGMLGKVKSAIDNLVAPSSAEVTDEALSKEKDPVKAKLLEVDLLLKQLADVQLIQGKTIHALTKACGDIRKIAEEKLVGDKSEAKPEEKVESKEPKKSNDENDKPENPNK